MYTSHLKQCVTVYLLCLPFVLVESLGWKMIPIIAVTSFTLAGYRGPRVSLRGPVRIVSTQAQKPAAGYAIFFGS